MRIFIFLLFLIFPKVLIAEEPFRICYFSLNNEKEFTETKKFAAKLNKFSPRKIIVTEYQNPDNNLETNKSFQAMIDGGAVCDGLVISGHHSGSFGGKRAKGQLELDFMENLACDPKYKAWFERINALWLQGCRTLGIGAIASEEDDDDDETSADFHTQRVGNVLEEDHLTQGFAELNRPVTLLVFL